MLQAWQAVRQALTAARCAALGTAPSWATIAAAAATGTAAQQQHQWQAHRHLAAKAKATSKAQGKGAKGKKGAAPAKKKTKQRMDTKPFDDKDPHLQRIVAMLVPQPTNRPDVSPADAAAANARARLYSSRCMQQHVEWRQGLVEKLVLKKAALAALPPDLRAAAEAEDLTPFPLTRHFYYDTPPAAYRDD